MQQLTEVFRMVTIKEREDSAQSRNKINLRALKIQNGFHMSLIFNQERIKGTEKASSIHTLFQR